MADLGITDAAVETIAGHFYTMGSGIAWSQIDPHSSTALNYKRWAREALEAAQPVVDREAIAKAIHGAVWPNCPNEHVIFADGTEGDAADAVLALLNGTAK